MPLASPGMLSRGLEWLLKPESPFYISPIPRPELVLWLNEFRLYCNMKHLRYAIPILKNLTSLGKIWLRNMIQEEALDCDWRERGLLMLYRSDHGQKEAERLVALAEQAGVEARFLAAAQLDTVDAHLQCNAICGVFFPEDAQVQPEAFIGALQLRLRERGVEFWEQTEVHLAGGSGYARGTRQNRPGRLFTADHVVVAAGAWSGRLLRPIGVRVLLQPGKGYSLTYPQMKAPFSVPVILDEDRVAITPFRDGLRIGGMMEINSFRPWPNERRMQMMLRAAARSFPALSALRLKQARPGVGFRPLTPDGLPVIERNPRYTNLYLATGHGMLGMTLAAITGKLISELVKGEPTTVDMRPFGCERFWQRIRLRQRWI
ncbi:MAG: FAD-dependent oxidoreductase [candidate division KSB1 bacterium]|nr:FAD-dependent oxidoreductase [candidate division KSB1 bacterium]